MVLFVWTAELWKLLADILDAVPDVPPVIQIAMLQILKNDFNHY